MYFYLATVIAIICYFLYKYYIYPLYLSPLRKIPGPPVDNFILGHYASILNRQQGEAFAYLVKQYGGMVRYHGILNKPYLIISDPTLVQQILVNCSYDYPKLIFDRALIKDLLGEGILLAEGDSHKRQRKILTPSFAFTNIKRMVPTFVQAGHDLKDLWIKQIGNKKEERITITALIPNITLDVIAQAYKLIITRNPSSLYAAILDTFPFIRKLPTHYNNQYHNSIKTINNISERLIAEQKNKLVRGTDLFSLLINANDNLPVDEQLTHKELLSQTTNTTLSWSLYFLAKNPDIQDRLRKEVSDVLIDRNCHPSIDEIEHLKFLECVFKETLRIVSPLPSLLRSNSKDEIMNGYFIPKKTPLFIPIHAIHHDPLIWGDDAEYFNPSRWLNPEIKSKITNSNFLPFGAGPKNCLGMKMAYLEFKSILSVIIRNFEFRSVEGFTVKKRFNGLAKPLPGVDLWVSKVDY
ncbi:16948_t:CDS:2 [Racocetra fulgida]|uniref:16948_t:CDS:1 n=1 Tax=Racocetra fulgida TaxID=60492 RepID=A0A9N8VJ64_9GLOM|nr:16948_t:CDS:2 [Racocetra fulgida]